MFATPIPRINKIKKNDFDFTTVSGIFYRYSEQLTFRCVKTTNKKFFNLFKASTSMADATS